MEETNARWCVRMNEERMKRKIERERESERETPLKTHCYYGARESPRSSSYVDSFYYMLFRKYQHNK